MKYHFACLVCTVRGYDCRSIEVLELMTYKDYEYLKHLMGMEFEND